MHTSLEGRRLFQWRVVNTLRWHEHFFGGWGEHRYDGEQIPNKPGIHTTVRISPTTHTRNMPVTVKVSSSYSPAICQRAALGDHLVGSNFASRTNFNRPLGVRPLWRFLIQTCYFFPSFRLFISELFDIWKLKKLWEIAECEASTCVWSKKCLEQKSEKLGASKFFAVFLTRPPLRALARDLCATRNTPRRNAPPELPFYRSRANKTN